MNEQIKHDPLLSLTLSAQYGDHLALKNVALEVGRGEILGVVGAIGCGKSTLALAILRLLSLKGGKADGTLWFNGRDGVFLGIFPTPEANPLDVATGVRKELPAIQADIPEGMQITLLYDSTEAISASIVEVFKTIGEAAAIVVIIIFLFLGSFRAVVIPIVTIPLSLIGVSFLIEAAI